jgi:hypothetical protein
MSDEDPTISEEQVDESVMGATEEEVVAQEGEEELSDEEILAEAAAVASGDDEEVEEGEEKPAVTPKKGSYQARIDELTAERRSADRRALQLEIQLESTRRELAAIKEPAPEDFADYKDFVRATAKFEAKKEKLELGTQAVVSELGASQQAYEKFQVERFKEAAAEHKGFEAKAKQIGQVLTPQTEAYHALFESERFGDIIMNMEPQDAVRIAAMSPRAQVKEIMRIETQLEAGMVKAQNKKVSSAPPPVARSISGKTERQPRQPDKMSMKDYAEMRKAQIRKSREQR